jgi:hypothetical protein
MGRVDKSELSKVKGVDPQWLSRYSEQDNSMAGMDEYRVIPRLKIVQAMTKQELKKKFHEGGICIMPGEAQVAPPEEPFLFVPQFFFVEFCKWADREDKGTAIVARSFDPTSDIAKRARNAELRYEAYEDGTDKQYRYVESLNFPGVIYGDNPLAGTPAVLDFSRGEFSQGRNFISAIKLRKERVGEQVVPIPLWAQVWELKSVFRDRGERKWWGWGFQPAEVSMILENESETFKATHEDLKSLFLKNKIVVDRTEGDDDGEGLGDTKGF